MDVTRLHMKCIFFLASLTLSCSRHISFDIEDVNRLESPKGNCDGVCMTPGCIKTAARIISSWDESVDPCENFYQFACGNWMSSDDIPEVIAEVQHEVDRKLNALVEKKLDGTEPAYVKMLKEFYDTCMDLETIDRLGSEPLKKDLINLGGWPVVEGSQWNESTFDWVDTLIAFRRLGYDFYMLINLSVGTDQRNRTNSIIQLPRLYLPRLSRQSLIRGLNDSLTAAHYKMGIKEAVLLGADETTAEKELLEALSFEMELAKISMPEEEEKEDNEINTDFTSTDLKHLIFQKKKKERKRRDVNGNNYIKYTVGELQNLIQEIPWLRFFNGLLNDEITEDENVAVYDPVFLKKLVGLLKKTEKRVLANYMFWRIVDRVKYDLSKEWREIHPERTIKDKYRKKVCFKKVSDRHLSVALSSYYVRLYFKEDSKNAVMELTKYIQREFLRILENSDWMDNVTKKEALEKANSMKFLIGYPTKLLNDSAIMELYENLKISSSSYYENVLNVEKWQTDNTFSSLRKPQNEWARVSLATAVGAYQDDEENLISVYAGILQGVFFDRDRPHYMNFGAIGQMIGHEITHGFDVKGKKYNKDGNEVSWWDKTTDELYHKRVQCMIDQYSNYTLESGIKVNGEFTRDENIADNGGLKEAYRAYRTWVKDNGPERLLPGINYNQNQLFWISAANAYCSKIPLEVKESLVSVDQHSPDEFRVIGPMSNLQEFSDDFGCTPDSPMNRRNKCHVW